jgi:hypothetical protein
MSTDPDLVDELGRRGLASLGYTDLQVSNPSTTANDVLVSFRLVDGCGPVLGQSSEPAAQAESPTH